MLTASIMGVTSPLPDGAYREGTVVPIAVTFSEPVTVTGTPQLTLDTGAVDRQATFANHGTLTLVFDYTVQAGDTSGDLDYANAAALGLNGGTIQDALLADALLTLPSPGTAGSLGANKNLVIDTTAPDVLSVAPGPTLVADADVGPGEFTVAVGFSEAMDVSVNPTLTFTPDVSTTLVAAGGTWTDATHFVATYDVADAGVTVPSVAIGVSGAKDPAGNLQAVHAGGNDFQVDTQNPTFNLPAVATPRNQNAGVLAIDFSEPVTGFDVGDLSLARNGKAVTLTPDMLTGTGSSYSLDLSSVTNLGGSYVLGVNAPGGIVDAAGNALSAGDVKAWAMNVGNLELQAGALRFDDNAPGGLDDQLSIGVVGGMVRFHSNNTVLAGGGLTQVDGNTVDVDPAALSSITINAAGGTDTLTVDFSVGNPIPAGGLNFDGGDPSVSPGDKLVIAGGSFSALEYSATGSGAGSLSLDGSQISFTGLEPVTVNSAVGITTIAIDDGNSHAATITAGPLPGQNTLTIDGGLESLTFANPDVELRLNADAGSDTFTIDSLDPGFRASLAVTGSTGALDTFNLNTSLLLGSATSAGNINIDAEATNLNAADVTTAGTQTYQGPLTLGTDVTLSGSVVTTQGVVAGGGHSLTISGDAVFGDEAGDTLG
ncbi:MAG: hypothetical protein ACM3U2_17705, partial [Deltaproteobacteria bacterium]